MISEIRSSIKEWISARINNAGNVYCDYIPEHDTGEIAVSFMISDFSIITDLQNGKTLASVIAKIYVNSKSRTDIDDACDKLLDLRTEDGSILHNIFYVSLNDLQYEPNSDLYLASLLTLKFNVKCND
jgi:hypothetical protein